MHGQRNVKLVDGINNTWCGWQYVYIILFCFILYIICVVVVYVYYICSVLSSLLTCSISNCKSLAETGLMEWICVYVCMYVSIFNMMYNKGTNCTEKVLAPLN